jgi:hypothetical protein
MRLVQVLLTIAKEDAEGSEDAVVGARAYTVRVGSDDFCLAPTMPDPRDREIVEAFRGMPLPNLGNLRALLHLSDVAYKEPAELGAELERLGFGRPGDGARLAECTRDATACTRVHPDRQIEFFSVDVAPGGVASDTQVLWAQHRSEPFVVIAFRGTESFTDVLTDGDFPRVPFLDGAAPGWGRVHGGFFGAYRTVRPLLEQRLATLPRGTRIWVTGHSLGGALASLFAADLLFRMERGNDLAFQGLVTFGSPRVGDTAFFTAAERMAVRKKVGLHRVQNVSMNRSGYDPVCHVPFRSTFGPDFGHVGAPLKVYENGHLDYGDSTARMVEPSTAMEDAIAAFKAAIGSAISAAFPHFLARYRERLDRAFRGPLYPELRACGQRRD